MSLEKSHKSVDGTVARISSEPKRARNGEYLFRGVEISAASGPERAFLIIPEFVCDFGREDLWSFPFLCWEGAAIAGYGLELNNLLDDRSVIYSVTPKSCLILEPYRPVRVTEAVDAARCPRAADVKNRVAAGEPFWMAKGRMVHMLFEHMVSHGSHDEAPRSFREAFRKARPVVWEVAPGSKVPIEDQAFRLEAEKHYSNLSSIWQANFGHVERVTVEMDRISIRWGLKGRVDAIIHDGAKNTIVELKSGKVSAEEHRLQLSGYSLLFSDRRSSEMPDGVLAYSATGQTERLSSFEPYVILEGRNRAVCLKHRYTLSSDTPPDGLLECGCANTLRCFFRSDCIRIHGHPSKGGESFLQGRARQYYEYWFRMLSRDLWEEEGELAHVLDPRTLARRIDAGVTARVAALRMRGALAAAETKEAGQEERRLTGASGTSGPPMAAGDHRWGRHLWEIVLDGAAADIGPGEEVIVHQGDPCAEETMRGRVVEVNKEAVTIWLNTPFTGASGDDLTQPAEEPWFVDRLPFTYGREASRKGLWTFLISADPQVADAVLCDTGHETDPSTRAPQSVSPLAGPTGGQSQTVEEVRETERALEKAHTHDRTGAAGVRDLCFGEGLREELNEEQEEAVEAALANRPCHLVHGPPGTGKTRVLARLIRICLDRGERVLIACPTNIALDRVLISLVELGVKEFLRIGGRANASEEFLDALAQLGNPPALLKDLASLDLDIESFRTRVSRSRLVGATAYQCAAHPFFLRQRFDRVIVDEAGQLDEPSTLAPLTLAPTFVLAGDHLQLPPVVRSRSERSAAETEVHGLERSLFERLFVSSPPSAISRLTTQYRMNQEIQDIPSRLFYDSTLRPAQAAAGRRLSIHTSFSHDEQIGRIVDPESPVVFVDVEGRDSGKSRPEEALAAARIVDALLTCGVPATEIGVISPYRAQQMLIRNQLTEARAGAHLPSVDTVDRFQGGEKEVIILSLARSDNVTSFLADRKRLNVSLSRARSKLILLGHGAVLERHPLFAALLEGITRIRFH